ncbi:TorF family putative porin [Colwellia sp. RSH04]|uniref:TorF family putative porin n=1 Tax=Colwellia sp. RSH04 TaxID=2305464 RepID=UPI0015F9046D|nr:TorF family putative porin [Colwellia sp. RSH04]
MKSIKVPVLFTTLFISLEVIGDVSVNTTITSDYVFRGISQTNSSPAIQVGLNYQHDSGLFLGTWASNVDFDDDANAEVDYYVGYTSEINEIFSYDITYAHYTYLGYSSAVDANYGELVINAYLNAFTLNLAYTADYANAGDTAQYIGGSYDLSLPNEYVMTLQAGYSLGNAFKDNEYVDYSVTLAKTLYKFDFSAAVINTDLSNVDNADLRFVIGVSRSF